MKYLFILLMLLSFCHVTFGNQKEFAFVGSWGIKTQDEKNIVKLVLHKSHKYKPTGIEFIHYGLDQNENVFYGRSFILMHLVSLNSTFVLYSGVWFYQKDSDRIIQVKVNTREKIDLKEFIFPENIINVCKDLSIIQILNISNNMFRFYETNIGMNVGREFSGKRIPHILLEEIDNLPRVDTEKWQ